jgi:hypothetical protein
MYLPEFTVRVEVCRTDAETLREWRVVLGGAQRGGFTDRHGYLPTGGPLLDDAVEEMVWQVRLLLEEYACTLGPSPLHLDLP